MVQIDKILSRGSYQYAVSVFYATTKRSLFKVYTIFSVC